MPLRLTKRLEPAVDGCLVRLSQRELEAMGLRVGDAVEFELRPTNDRLERIPL